MKRRKIHIGIVLMIITTIFASTGQIFFKFASANISLNIIELITNIPLIVGLTLYAIGAILFTVALRQGPLSMLFPILALNFVWVMIFSNIIFKELITGPKVLATIFIIIGVIFIGHSQKQEKVLANE